MSDAYERGYNMGYYFGDLADPAPYKKPHDIRQYHIGLEQGEIDKQIGLQPDYRRNYRPAKKSFDLSAFDYRLAEAFAVGYDHGKNRGEENNPFSEEFLPELRYVYDRGYETGVRAYCEINLGEEA